MNELHESWASDIEIRLLNLHTRGRNGLSGNFVSEAR